MKRPLKVALIGCGGIVGDHISAFERIRAKAEITVFCDPNLETAKAAKEKYNHPDAGIVSDYREALEDPTIDAVDLSLPHHLHETVAIEAAKSYKHVLCEKPLGRNVEECDRMIKAAKENGVFLMPLEPMRMASSMKLAAKMIREGTLGEILGIQGTFAYWQPAEKNAGWRGSAELSGGGQLMDGGIHVVDVLLHLGGKADSVQAMTSFSRPELGTKEDLAIVNIKFRQGFLGQLFTGHASCGRGAAPLVSAYGSEACISIDVPGRETGLELCRKNAPAEFFPSEHSWRSGYRNAIEHFVDAIREEAILYATPEDGRENVKFVLACYESAKTGREIKL